MQLTKISRSKSFEMINVYGLKAWDKFGLEAEMSENENPIELYKELDAIIEQSFKESYPGNPNQERVKQVDKPELSKELTITLDGINACTELEGVNGLKSFWLPSKSNLILLTAYKAKEKQLKDAK